MSENQKPIGGNKRGNNRKPEGGRKSEGSRGNGRQRGKNNGNQNWNNKFQVDKQERFDASIEQELNNGNFKLRGKKTQVSINHLLDFQLPEVERELNSTPRRTNRRKNDTFTHLHGDSFINVNYRLLVDDRYDYKELNNDPNKLVDKEKIVRVIVPKGQNCPICLNEVPIAPRMVTCGHVFCSSCLINFFDIQEMVKNPNTGVMQKKKYKECPLCGSIVKPTNTKDVLFEDDYDFGKKPCVNNETAIPIPGKETTLKLMCKPHDSLLALPVSSGLDPRKVGNFPSVKLREISEYSHIMKCGADFALQLYQNDINAIENQYEIDKALYNDSGKYVKQALESIHEKISSILEQNEESLVDRLADDFKNTLKFSDTNQYDDSNAFFFYQTYFKSPTKYFLTPLDIKILLTIFEGYHKFPELLTVTVENVHYGTQVTEALIRRYKYMGHLPIGSEIALLDLDWRSVPFIEKDIYAKFATELKQRRRSLMLKKQREDKDKKSYEEKLEREQQEFYRRENLEYPTWEAHVNKPEVTLTSLPTPQQLHREKEEKKMNKYNEKTIWGTSIQITEDEKASKESKEFEQMLLAKMQAEKSEKKKKKGKIMLFSNTQQHL
ncbi:E3 ubiquitin-protein ligase MAG2 [Nakaseomyces bracarensis]|uniref:E3 ubiquitin-protein ligase MAG2 n=1 Tax=Nakaseomyces bracarensis TaxID=273131 RepID=A0ABR4NSS8_9SACH